MSRQLIDLAKKPDGSLAAKIKEEFSSEKLADGSAVVADHGDFLYALASDSEPQLYIDDDPAPPMKKLDGGLWYATARLLQGWSHAHFYRVDGKMLGDKRFDTAAYYYCVIKHDTLEMCRTKDRRQASRSNGSRPISKAWRWPQTTSTARSR